MRSSLCVSHKITAYIESDIYIKSDINLNETHSH